MADKPIKLTVEEDGVKQTTKDVKGLSSSLGGLQSASGPAFGALAAGALAGAAAIKALADRMVNTLDEMNTLGNAADLSTKFMNGLRFQSDATGKTLEAMVPKNLAKRLQEAKDKAGLARDSFADLGISLEEISKFGTEEIYLRMAENVSTMDDSQLAAAASAELLGRNGREMMSAFANGREDLEAAIALTSHFGYDVGPEAQKAASDWQMANARLNLSLENVQRNLAPVISISSKLIEYFSTGLIGATAAVSAQLGELGTRASLFFSGDFGALASRMAKDLTGLDGAAAAVADSLLKWKGVQDPLADESAEGSVPDMTRKVGALTTTLGGADTAARRLTVGLAAMRKDAAADAEWAEGMTEGWTSITSGMDAAVEAAQDFAYTDAWDTVLSKMDGNVDKAEEYAELYKAYVATVATGAVSIADSAAKAVGNLAKEGTDAAKGAAIVQFGISRALAIADIAMKTRQAFMAAAVIGPPQSFVAQGIVLAQGVAAGIAVATQPPPSFHIGHRMAAPDEYSATLRSRESVLTPGATAALGGPEAVARLNGGTPAQQSGPMALYVDQEPMGVVISRMLDNPDSTLSYALRSASPVVR